jgi:hypothetical protein
MIPKKLHFVWVGALVPAAVQTYIDSWRRQNPDYEIVRWSEENIPFSIDFIAQAYREKKWAKVADAVRLWAVHEQGGIYLDTDVEVVAPLDSLLGEACFFGFQLERHPTDWVNNAVFGAEAGHWFLAKALDRIFANSWHPALLERPTQFGPKLITRLLREEGLRSYDRRGVRVKDVFIHPTDVFYPFTWEEAFSPDCVTERTLAIHFWEQNWKGSVSPAARLAKAGWDTLQRARFAAMDGFRRVAGSA